MRLISVLASVALLASGCSNRAPLPPEGRYQVHAIAHATTYDRHGGVLDTHHCSWAEVVGTEVYTPAWVADQRYDSRQLRAGRTTWWLADRPETCSDEHATWSVVRGER